MSGKVFVDELLVPVEKSFSLLDLPKETPLFVHYDNAKAHVCKTTTDFLISSTLERLPHPPYSPDIIVCATNRKSAAIRLMRSNK
jgi:hypothetical protein